MSAFWDFPADAFEAGTTFWLEVTDANLSEPRGVNNEFAALTPREGHSCLWVQRLQSGEGGNHLDLHADDVAAEAARAESLGAGVVRKGEGLIALRSPGGFPFCIVAYDGETAIPAPVTWPGGQRSIADQICIDIPAQVYGSERDFWVAFSGRRPRPSDSPEFERLERPPGMPLEILLQRRDEAEFDDPVSAHIDLATSDLEAETLRHSELGAVPIERFEHWQVLHDPTGLEYCITDRAPRPVA